MTQSINAHTYAAVVLFGYKPRRFMPGLYVQYVRFKGEDVTSEVENEMQLEGNYCERAATSGIAFGVVRHQEETRICFYPTRRNGQ